MPLPPWGARDSGAPRAAAAETAARSSSQHHPRLSSGRRRQSQCDSLRLLENGSALFRHGAGKSGASRGAQDAVSEPCPRKVMGPVFEVGDSANVRTENLIFRTDLRDRVMDSWSITK